MGSLICDTTILNNPIITTDTTWDVSGSPYIIQSSLVVESGATLNISEMESFAEIFGTLNINGTQENKVIITSINDSGACGPSIGGAGAPFFC